MNLVFRDAVVEDAPEIARLLTSLGHPTDASGVRERWEAWRAEGNHARVAAREDGTLAGLVTLHRTWVLHRPQPLGRITSLVVDEPDRGAGIGRALMVESERRMSEVGCGLLEITSSERRVEAHGFYRRLGYEQTSVRLMKKLTSLV